MERRQLWLPCPTPRPSLVYPQTQKKELVCTNAWKNERYIWPLENWKKKYLIVKSRVSVSFQLRSLCNQCLLFFCYCRFVPYFERNEKKGHGKLSRSGRKDRSEKSLLTSNYLWRCTHRDLVYSTVCICKCKRWKRALRLLFGVVFDERHHPMHENRIRNVRSIHPMELFENNLPRLVVSSMCFCVQRAGIEEFLLWKEITASWNFSISQENVPLFFIF